MNATHVIGGHSQSVLQNRLSLPSLIDVRRAQGVALPWHSLQQGFFIYAKRAMPHGALVAISLVDQQMRIPVMQAVVTLLINSQRLRNEEYSFQAAVQGRGREK